MRVEAVRVVAPPAADAARDLRAAEGGGSVAQEVSDAVAEIVAAVAEAGDEAVLEHTRRLDTGGAQPWPLRVDALELESALHALADPLREALELAIANVRAVALADPSAEREVALPQGQRVLLRDVPVRRAAVYVPGGAAPYPSTVVMGVVAAQVAGVPEVVVCAPPRADGDAHPVILAACALCQASEVYRMGGAQAVAALALGTETIAAAEVIAGPGSVYVQEAKRQLAHRVGIDSFAGPSELLVVVDEDADARPVALDLLAQADHGTTTTLIALAAGVEALDALAAELSRAGAAEAPDARCHLIAVGDLGEALAFVEAYAPEHLQLVGTRAEALAPRVHNAGCVFVGAFAGTAFGDYVAGSNHVLPTGGAARFASVLSPRTFRRRMAQVQLDRQAATRLAPAGALIARAEGFEGHARSMEARMGQNGGHG